MMHSFNILVSLASIALIASSNIQAAPTSNNAIRSGPKLSCSDDAKPVQGQLIAGDYIYGSGSTKVGYKSVTDANGKEELQVVRFDENDSKIRLLNNVIRKECNSTNLNMFSDRSKFGTNTPVKLLADVGRDGIPFCLGLSNSDKIPSDIALVPCSNTDDDSQANQFWVDNWKYNNLYPAFGKSNTTENVENYLPIRFPTKDATSGVYQTAADCDNCESEDYGSFYIST